MIGRLMFSSASMSTGLICGFSQHCRLAFICADRWMRNAYGRRLRRKILDGPYSVDCVLTMHDAAAFDAEVYAYPAITVLSRSDQNTVVTGLANGKLARKTRWAVSKQSMSLSRPSVTGARLPGWHASDDVARRLPANAGVAGEACRGVPGSGRRVDLGGRGSASGWS